MHPWAALAFFYFYTDAKVVHDWIGQKVSEGKISPKDLMKSVIAVSLGGRKWTDGAIPSTRSDVLRRISNTLNFSTGTARSALLDLHIKWWPSEL